MVGVRRWSFDRSITVPALVFLIALALRVAMALWLPANVIWPDGHRYEHVALNLLYHHSFGSLADNRASFPTQSIAIAAVYAVFGKSYLALRLVFAFVGAGTVVVAYALTLRLFGEAAALISGMLLALYPYFIYLSALFEYPQTLFVFLMGLFFLWFFKFMETGSTRALFPAGLLLGVAILGVPTVLVFVPFVLLHLGSNTIAQTAKRVATVLLALGIPLGLWTVHNYEEYGRFMLVNAAGGINFWSANNETYYRYGKHAVVPPCAPKYRESDYCLQLRAVQKELGERGLTPDERIFEEESIAWRKRELRS